ncbi:MAG TPA: hypothetical protein ENO11_04730 [Desulfobacteraceae bacterium]|nr:hypothetical protein [Desulfobacteraceae bacterium]
MGALAHYLEAEELPTTQISLIREHTETIKPPRALWVPFELGRPLGLPNDPAFQRRVLLAALELFELPEGPVLVDFSDDVPEQAAGPGNSLDTLACPVSFVPLSQEKTETEKLLSAFRSEVTEFRSWYDLGLDKRGYSALAYFSPDAAGRLMMDFVQGEPLKFPENISSPAAALRFAAQDLKAFYYASVLSRPDFALPDASEFNRWFWQKTAAGRVLKAVGEICLHSKDEQLRMTGGMLLVPFDQA